MALISGAVFVLAHFQALANPFIINDDVRQQLYWMQQWQDPALFRGDFLTGYARAYVPWGVKGLYWLASWWVSPLYFAKLLPGFLFVFLAICLFKIGTRLAMTAAWGGRWWPVFWLMPFFLDNLAGGLARSFAAPLLALFWLGWLARRPWVMGAALLLQALFIPYIFMVAALAALLAWLLARLGRDGPPPFPAQTAHFILLGLGAVLVVAMNLQFSADGYGPLVSAARDGQSPRVLRPWPLPNLAGSLTPVGTHQPLGIHRPVSGMGPGGRRPGLCGPAGSGGGRAPAPGLARLAATRSNPPGTWDWPPWPFISWPGSSC